jgi:hypothetical protein
MKRVSLISFLLLLIFASCKKEDNNPVSTNSPSPIVGIPVPTPVGTPVGSTSTAKIGPAGGSVSSPDGVLSVSIPAGALAKDTTISVQAITNNAPGGLGNGYRLGPNGMQFSTPVTLQFKYPGDSVQVPELLRVAFQDTDHIWYALPDYSVDSTTGTVSANVSHFTDYIDFEEVSIYPPSARVWVNQTVDLYLLEAMTLDNVSRPQPVYRVTGDQIAWSASSGSVTGDPDPSVNHAIFRAPPTKPAGNPVRVTAALNRRFTYHGTIVPTNRTMFFSYITVTDSSASFHIDLYYHDPQYYVGTLYFTLDDTCNMDVQVNRRIVSVTNIVNHQPGVTPVSVTNNGCTLSWVPGGPGPMNIKFASGTVVDSTQSIALTFVHAAFTEQFHIDCPSTTLGGGPAPGDPGDLAFPINTTSVDTKVDAHVRAVIVRK